MSMDSHTSKGHHIDYNERYQIVKTKNVKIQKKTKLTLFSPLHLKGTEILFHENCDQERPLMINIGKPSFPIQLSRIA